MTDSFQSEHWPKEIRYISQDKRLEVDFDDGSCFSYPVEMLRVESPSAEVQGHSPSQKQTSISKRSEQLI